MASLAEDEADDTKHLIKPRAPSQQPRDFQLHKTYFIVLKFSELLPSCPPPTTASAATRTASAKTTKSSAMSIPRSTTTAVIALDTLRSANNAIVGKIRAVMGSQRDPKPQSLDLDEGEAAIFRSITLLAKGGYNTVWLVRLHGYFEVAPSGLNDQGNSHIATRSFDEYVLRLPCEDALLPYQITNDVAFKKFIATKLPHIPVPLVFFYQARDEQSASFIAEEYIDATPLSSNWMTLTFEEKESMAKQLAKITVDLADIHFAMIGGLDPDDFQSGPTVEGAKIFKGRYKLHSNQYYPIGPYRTTKEYILACYEREIAYYSHADTEDIDQDLFQEVSVLDFIKQLQQRRDALAQSDIVDEPFTLVHGDFHGRNILSKGDHILGILDWEFAGSYPISETLSGGGFDVVDADSEELDEENTVWDRKIRDFIREEADARHWQGGKIDLLLGNGNLELGRARVEMFP